MITLIGKGNGSTHWRDYLQVPSIPIYVDSYYNAAFGGWMPTSTIDPATLAPCPGVSPAPPEPFMTPQAEASFLLEFKAGLNESTALESWDPAADMCAEWEGVYCDASGYVQQMYVWDTGGYSYVVCTRVIKLNTPALSTAVEF